MELLYFKGNPPNFGDELNWYIFESLFIGSDFKIAEKYSTSGNIIINPCACRTIDILGDLSNVSQRYRDSLRYYDQDCLNVMFYDQVTYLPLNFCVNHKLNQDIARDRYFDIHLRHYAKEDILNAIENPDIVHYTGPKPDKSSPSCKIWQLACAQAGLVDEYIESVFSERQKLKRS